MPLTRGSSGPTTVKPTPCCLANWANPRKSVASIPTFCASIAVPALPYLGPVLVQLEPANADACYVTQDPTVASIKAAYVKEARRTRGLATAMLARAIEWARSWPRLTVAVNVSPLQLRRGALLERTGALVADGLAPSSLVLEVTESALMEDTATSASVLGELRRRGFGIAIDDFGTGYSSLAYLKQLPASSIKVDRTFTSQLPDPHDLSVVMAILAIADTYGLHVVAEGVETTEQVEVLRALGCQLGQGFYFARAVPATELTRLLQAGPFSAP